MTDPRQSMFLVLRDCLSVPRSKEHEIQGHADHLLGSVAAGDSPDALRKLVAAVQTAFGDVVNDTTCDYVVTRLLGLAGKTH